MTVLQLVSSEGYYGVESMLVALAGALSRLGCESIVGVFRDSRNPHTEVAEEARRQGLRVEIVPCDGRWDSRAVGWLRSVLADDRVDVLHTHGYKADFYGAATVRPTRTTLVATSHNWPNKRLSMRAYAALDRLALRRFDAVVAPSPVVADKLKHWGVKTIRLTNGVDAGRFQGAKATLRQEVDCGRNRLVGFVGRLVPGKGGALLLKAAQYVLAVRPDTTFVFVGGGPSRKEWEALAARLGIAGNVIFTGPRGDIPGVYASLDLLVLPSLDEALPMCLLEGMAAGTPVIATRVGAVPDLVIPNVTGALIEPGQADGLAGAIVELLRDPVQARRLGESGRAHVMRNYSVEATARNYLDVYERALRQREIRMQQGCGQQELSA